MRSEHTRGCTISHQCPLEKAAWLLSFYADVRSMLMALCDVSKAPTSGAMQDHQHQHQHQQQMLLESQTRSHGATLAGVGAGGGGGSSSSSSGAGDGGGSAKGLAKSEPQQPIRCEICQVTLLDAAAYATHANARKHKKRLSEPLDVEPAVMNKIVGDLRTCLKFLTPPNWSMSPAEIERMEPTSLSHFPLDQFLAHYTAQMDEFIASRVAQAADSIATSEQQLAKNKAGTQELRQQLDELHDIKEMAEAGALSRDELSTVVTLAGGQMPP